jgi:hypothetical protein
MAGGVPPFPLANLVSTDEQHPIVFRMRVEQETLLHAIN